MADLGLVFHDQLLRRAAHLPNELLCCATCLPDKPPSHTTCLFKKFLSHGTHLADKMPCRPTRLFDKPLSHATRPSNKIMSRSLYPSDKLQSHLLIRPTNPCATPHVRPENWQAAAPITIIEKSAMRLYLQVMTYRTAYFTHQHVAQHTSQPTLKITHYNSTDCPSSSI